MCFCGQLWAEMSEELTSGVADYSNVLADVCYHTIIIMYVYIRT